MLNLGGASRASRVGSKAPKPTGKSSGSGRLGRSRPSGGRRSGLSGAADRAESATSRASRASSGQGGTKLTRGAGRTTRAAGNAVAGAGAGVKYAGRAAQLAGYAAKAAGVGMKGVGAGVSAAGAGLTAAGGLTAATVVGAPVGAALAKAGAVTGKSGAAIGKAGSAVSSAGTAMSQAGRSVAQAGKAVQQAGQRVKGAGSNLMNTGFPKTPGRLFDEKVGKKIDPTRALAGTLGGEAGDEAGKATGKGASDLVANLAGIVPGGRVAARVVPAVLLLLFAVLSLPLLMSGSVTIDPEAEYVEEEVAEVSTSSVSPSSGAATAVSAVDDEDDADDEDIELDGEYRLQNQWYGAYRNAARAHGVPWPILAGIGEVASQHGTTNPYTLEDLEPQWPVTEEGIAPLGAEDQTTLLSRMDELLADITPGVDLDDEDEEDEGFGDTGFVDGGRTPMLISQEIVDDHNIRFDHAGRAIDVAAEELGAFAEEHIEEWMADWNAEEDTRVERDMLLIGNMDYEVLTEDEWDAHLDFWRFVINESGVIVPSGNEMCTGPRDHLSVPQLIDLEMRCETAIGVDPVELQVVDPDTGEVMDQWDARQQLTEELIEVSWVYNRWGRTSDADGLPSDDNDESEDADDAEASDDEGDEGDEVPEDLGEPCDPDSTEGGVFPVPPHPGDEDDDDYYDRCDEQENIEQTVSMLLESASTPISSRSVTVPDDAEETTLESLLPVFQSDAEMRARAVYEWESVFPDAVGDPHDFIVDGEPIEGDWEPESPEACRLAMTTFASHALNDDGFVPESFNAMADAAAVSEDTATDLWDELEDVTVDDTSIEDVDERSETVFVWSDVLTECGYESPEGYEIVDGRFALAMNEAFDRVDSSGVLRERADDHVDEFVKQFSRQEAIRTQPAEWGETSAVRRLSHPRVDPGADDWVPFQSAHFAEQVFSFAMAIVGEGFHVGTGDVTLQVLIEHGIPRAAAEVYIQVHEQRHTVLAQDYPGCDPSVAVIAAIGNQESNHGRHGGASVQPGSYDVRPKIFGDPVNSSTYQGARAMGPMQFMPPTWETLGWDFEAQEPGGDPHNYRDAVAASMRHLCETSPMVTDVDIRHSIASYYGADRDGYADSVLAYRDAILQTARRYGPAGGIASRAADGTGGAAIAFAETQIGVPYSQCHSHWPRCGPPGNRFGYPGSPGPYYDCSGFVVRSWAEAGVRIPAHTTATMLDSSQIRAASVSLSEMQPGDVWVYRGHTGMYVGGGRAIHSTGSSSNPAYGGVEYAPMESFTNKPRFMVFRPSLLDTGPPGDRYPLG